MIHKKYFLKVNYFAASGLYTYEFPIIDYDGIEVPLGYNSYYDKAQTWWIYCGQNQTTTTKWKTKY